ncbi:MULTISPECIES: hypothetical protein [Pantoea]|jgi:hypothetical protein|uniref:hypothetical protein n=1 Tax=Pantoea TaxID=53335 RepID=UPI001F40E1CE|nr:MULTISPECIES: hypothetical protein [Pantoea]UIL54922.1 hypothetical protein LZU96_22435 [Pantoea agglomerans]
MRELKESEIQNVSGGSLTSLILDFFKSINASSQEETTEWTRPEEVPAANPISGQAFGMGIVSVVAAVAFGLFAF